MVTNKIDGFFRQARRTAAGIPGCMARLCNDAWREKTLFHVTVLVKRTTRHADADSAQGTASRRNDAVAVLRKSYLSKIV